MAISISALTDIIYIPKADLTLIQASPEVRELNLNSFHLWLRDWEDSEEAMPRPKTHTHNTEVSLAGLTYARIIEILSPYTVEFEDGQYTVNCTGANHNLSDVKVANQVSLIVNNAAGLIGNAQIEYASFNGYVTLDPNSIYDGTLYPVGTPQQPVNNLEDALLIASVRGFTSINLLDDLDIDDTYDLDGFTIQAANESIILTIDTIASVNDLTLYYLTLADSVLDGGVDVRNCIVRDVTYVNGHIHNCGLSGTITLGGNRKSIIGDCYTVDQDNPPTINMGGSGNDLAMPNYSGIASFTNLSGASNELGIGLDAGYVILDSTITAGTVIVSGIGLLMDSSTGASVVNTDGILNKAQIAEATWDATAHHVHFDASTSNTGTEYPMGTAEYPLNNLADVVSIAEAHGKTGIWFKGQMLITQDLVGYSIRGTTSVLNDVAVVVGVDVSNTVFDLCTVTGTAVGSSNMQALNGIVADFSGFDGVIINGGCSGTVTANAGGTIIGKSIAFAATSDVVDANGAAFIGLDFNGVFTLQNLTGGGFFQAGGSFGQITLDSSVNGGVGRIYGTLEVVDNSTSMTWIDDGTISRESIDNAVWTGSNGLSVLSDLSFIKNIEGGRWKIEGTQMIFYMPDNTTEVARFNITYDASQNPTERTRV